MRVKELIAQLGHCNPEAKVEASLLSVDGLEHAWYNIEDVTPMDDQFVLVNLGDQTMG